MIIGDADFRKNFWPNWWSNFSADLIVGIFLTSLVAWVLRRRQRVDLTMGTTLRVMEDGRTRAFFSIENRGNVVMRKEDSHFHVFVRERQIPLNVLSKLTCRRLKYLNGTYVELKGTLNTSVFP